MFFNKSGVSDFFNIVCSRTSLDAFQMKAATLTFENKNL
jgi:hypothetical protein